MTTVPTVVAFTNPIFVTGAANAVQAFREALDDDLNTAEALAAIFEFVREANIAMDQGGFLSGNRESALAVLETFDSFFDVLKPTAATSGISDADIDKLMADRTAARKARDFARADAIRAELSGQGIILEDTKDGIRWKRK